jgi:hypothetical protein
MKLIKHPTLILFLLFSTSLIYGQNTCENIISITVDKLPLLLKNNQQEEIQKQLDTIEATCGLSEFTLRTRIIYQIINKENTKENRQKYLHNRFDNVLITRWDDSYLSDHQEIYLAHKKKYEYIPMRHPVDSLLKIKASSILNSSSYKDIDIEEKAILYLFNDNIETYSRMIHAQNNENKKVEMRPKEAENKYKSTFGLHTGVFMPIGENDFFGKSVTGGLSYMSPFSNDFVFDLHYKFRVHPKSRIFDFRYKDNIREVDAITSHVISVGAGYKLLDKNKFIILPKLNLGLGFIWTGLSETEYGEDDEGNETETLRLRNVNTLHSTIGITFMRHVYDNLYFGFESNVHLIPYQWDSRLQSPIPSKYASLEFFVRF